MINTAQQLIHSGISESEYLYNRGLGAFVDIRTITPQEAKEILEGQIKNRKLSQQTILRYAKQMKAGRWKLNGETITFGGGMLIDGQHR